MDFKLVLPRNYINFDIQTKFEVNQTQIGHSIPKKLQKLTKVVISQNPILPKCHSPNMDFAHTNHELIFDLGLQKKFESKIQNDC